MLYPDTDYKTWAVRYGLEVKNRECPSCKKNFETTTPIAITGYRGLQAPLHECGVKYRHTVFVPVEKEEVNFWISFKYGT